MTLQRAIALVCQVCGDTGWVEAAPVVQKVTGEGERAVVCAFVPVPCFQCYPNRIGVLIS